MNSAILDIFRNIYFWVFVVSLILGYVSLRLGNHNRDQAAFADFPDKPEKYVFRSRVFYGLSIIFLLAVLAGLVFIIFNVLQIVRPNVNLDLSKITSAVSGTETPTETSLPEPAATETLVRVTATPMPTRTPAPTKETISGEYAIATIGNTNFQGVNVRLEPSTESDIVARLINQTRVFVINTPSISADGYSWRQVQLEDGTVGWIAEPFLIFDNQ